MMEEYGRVAVASFAGFFAALSVVSLSMPSDSLVPFACFVVFVAGLDWLARQKALVKSVLGSFLVGFVLAAGVVPYFIH